MSHARSGASRLLAVLLPANMLWVFFACTLQCMAVGEAGCVERVREDVCCQSESACAVEGEAACEVELSPGRADRCAIVAVERGVLGAGEYRPRPVASAAAPPAFGPAAVEPAEEARAPHPLAHAPPRIRPLDRLPTLLI
jgi:hypothetical protein